MGVISGGPNGPEKRFSRHPLHDTVGVERCVNHGRISPRRVPRSRPFQRGAVAEAARARHRIHAGSDRGQGRAQARAYRTHHPCQAPGYDPRHHARARTRAPRNRPPPVRKPTPRAILRTRIPKNRAGPLARNSYGGTATRSTRRRPIRGYRPGRANQAASAAGSGNKLLRGPDHPVGHQRGRKEYWPSISEVQRVTKR